MTLYSIEGNPFITRFKTEENIRIYFDLLGIEGNPFITRFKTASLVSDIFSSTMY